MYEVAVTVALQSVSCHWPVPAGVEVPVSERFKGCYYYDGVVLL